MKHSDVLRKCRLKQKMNRAANSELSGVIVEESSIQSSSDSTVMTVG
jgi:hypothetical protein